MFRFAPEGYPFIAFFAIIAIIAFFIGGMWIALLSFLLTLFMFFFFRDPERETPEGEGIFVSPADGKIILIKDIFEKDYLETDTKQISIFMSPLNVHVNRAPCDGIVKTVKHTAGGFKAAYRDEASLTNENIVMVIEGKQGSILVRQVAGFIARRAVCRAKVGDSLNRGQRYGIIKFSSRLDVYLPKETAIKVKSGDRVKAGETIIGVIK